MKIRDSGLDTTMESEEEEEEDRPSAGIEEET